MPKGIDPARRVMLPDNLKAVSTSAGVLSPPRPQTAYPPTSAGIIEREEEGTLILAPATGKFSRRVIFVNGYGGRSGWERIKQGRPGSTSPLGMFGAGADGIRSSSGGTATSLLPLPPSASP